MYQYNFYYMTSFFNWIRHTTCLDKRAICKNTLIDKQIKSDKLYWNRKNYVLLQRAYLGLFNASPLWDSVVILKSFSPLFHNPLREVKAKQNKRGKQKSRKSNSLSSPSPKSNYQCWILAHLQNRALPPLLFYFQNFSTFSLLHNNRFSSATVSFLGVDCRSMTSEM